MPLALNRQIRRFSAGAGAVVAAKEGVDFRIVATDDDRHGFEVIDKTPAEDKLANGSPGPQMLADLINKPIEELISKAVNLPIWRRTHRQDLPSFVRTRGGVS